MSCHKNHIIMCNNTLACTGNEISTSVSTMSFLIEIIFNLKAIKPNVKGSYDKLYLTLLWSFHLKFMKFAEGSFKKNSYEMTTSVRSSI